MDTIAEIQTTRTLVRPPPFSLYTERASQRFERDTPVARKLASAASMAESDELSLDTLPLPAEIGPYRVIDVLGAGGMGIVFRGQHQGTGELVAIKTVRTPGEVTLSSIRREIHALSRIRHPGVVRIVAQGVSQGLPWYAMELLRGRTLSDHISEIWRKADATPSTIKELASATESMPGEIGVFAALEPALTPPEEGRPIGTLLSLLGRLCAPLSFLHGMGLVHRDLKPDNVFIQEDGTPVLVDLGLAARFGGAKGREELEAAGKIMGSVRYMAPEQIRGELVDARADLYALGCILYECATGRPPFVSATAMSILYQHLHERPILPSRRAAGVPEALEQLILRLLEKRPQDRLGYADDVAAALAAMGADERAAPSRSFQVPYLYRPELAGRERALEELGGAVERLARGRRGAQIFLRGESGVGKTRLAMEISRLATRRQLTVLTGQCFALGAADAGEEAGVKAAPLHPFRPLLLAVADRCRAQGAEETARLLGPRGKILVAYEPALADLPGHREQPDPPPLPPEVARTRVIESLKETLFALAEATPLLFIVDDLQWADELSLSFLQALSEAGLEERPALVVGTYRMDETRAALEAIGRAPGVTTLDLGRLDAASVGAMVSGMLALRAPPPALVDALIGQSDGNPFFISEVLRAAIAEGMLTRDHEGRWRIEEWGRAAGSLAASLPRPRALAELIERRLGSLDAPERALVAWAAVLGREFDADLLTAVAGLNEAVAMGSIEALRVRQIIEEAGSGRLRFVHDKIREIAYERILEAPRRALHRRAAEVIEARSPGAQDTSPALAHHYAQAKVHDRASLHFTRAGDRARAVYANGQAIAFYRAAIAEERKVAAIGGEAASPRFDRILALAESLGDVLVLTGRQEEGRGAYGDALEASPEGARLERARLHRKIGKTWEAHHAHEEALGAYEAAERALGPRATERAEGWCQEWVQIQVERISIYYWQGQVGEIEALMEKVRPLVEEHAPPSQRAQFFQALIQLGLRSERHLASVETVRNARACLAANEEAGVASGILTARFALACILLWHGALEEPEAPLLATLQEGERTGDITLQARCLTYAMMLYRRRRDVAATRRVATRSLAVATAGQLTEYMGAARANLAWVAWRDYLLGDAERGARLALDLWRPLKLIYPFQWMALFPLVALESERGRTAEALALARALLHPKQQRLPGELEEALSQAIAAAEQGPLDDALALVERALGCAERLGYL